MSLLIKCFIIVKLLQGAMFPCNHAIWANWSPPHERTRLSSFTFSGSFFGTVVTFPVCGFLADKFGWQATFYIPGKGKYIILYKYAKNILILPLSMNFL